MLYQRILVPTDGSELTGRAIAAGVALAKTLGAEVHTLCVKEPFPYGAVAEMQPTPPQEFFDAQERSAKRHVLAVREACEAAGVPCQGATVEMHATSSISHWVETGLVVSGVDATSMRSTLSWTIKSLATSAARFGLDWLSFTTTSTGTVALPSLMPALVASLKLARMKLSASAKAAKGPVSGET